MPRTELTGQPSDLLRVVLPAAARGDLGSVRRFVEADPAWAHAIGPHQRTMLWEAAYRGREPVVAFLLDAGAERDAPACYYTPLCVAISPLAAAALRHHGSTADTLRDHGARIGLHDAAYLGDAPGVSQLLDADPGRLDEPRAWADDPDAARPVHYAAAAGAVAVFDLLLERGARVDPADWKLLKFAVWNCGLASVRALLARGVDPRPAGMTEWATDPEFGALAAEFGYRFDIDAPDTRGFPAIVDASRGNHNAPDDPRRVETLLAKGASVHARDHKGKTALHRAAQAGFVKITALLLEHGADPGARDLEEQTPLFDAARAARPEAAALLLDAGADAGAADRRGRTPLDIARRSKRPRAAEIVALLEGHAPA